MPEPSQLQVAVIGGGLVGSLNACFFGQRGMKVDLYEFRNDIRRMEHVPGKSINLALSVRGRSSLKAVGLENEIIVRHAIPMYARLIHDRDGSRRAIPYGKSDQCIFSVGRRFLNEVLLSAAEKHSNVNIHFSHKLVTCDPETGSMTFERYKNKEIVTAQANLIVGCDGAFSAVRRQMLKRPRFNYSQTYIPHGYMELTIPATPDGQFAMEVNYLHIWPRDSFMMIALPNQDKSYTVTLFMPFENFENLTTPEELLDFFFENFPDAVPLIGKKNLIEDYFRLKPAHLISVKCNPYHVGDKTVIMGDAAHAMVPFYGQGMNAGFEDCLIFDELLERYNFDLAQVLPEFTLYRTPDAEAICDLAMYNYVEMRHLVNSKAFLIRKKFDRFLNLFFADSWVPLYTMVTFSKTRYHLCVKNKKWQDKVINQIIQTAGVSSSVIGLSMVAKFLHNHPHWLDAALELLNKFKLSMSLFQK
ncbi:kynurenine 3-monooxygenase cn isoform X1 [Tachypleus tridentatus]|uniref:kynurenine 3-monooxygenase cn isoform X1 n=1 Tax=Tachypleus tridentatus TaxID=6853 RepID=UPI003FD16CEE